MTEYDNTSVGFRCPGQCYGLGGACPYAELVYEGWVLIAVECKLPKLIAPNTWLTR